MRAFAYATAESLEAASRALARSPQSLPKAGGTDLLDLMKERILEPSELVNLLRVRREGQPGELSALTTLAELAADEELKAGFPALQQAAAQAATPQVRHRGTLGGNLCQVSRCWYLRTPGHPCPKLGTGPCAATLPTGDNRYHGIFAHELCACAHPSNLAPALLALDARLALIGPEGARVIPMEELYELPRQGKLSDTTLRPGELIRGVLLESSPLTTRSTYLELRERQSFDFALVSVAAALWLEDGRVRDARLAAGAVAPIPYRLRGAEAALRGKPLAEAIPAAAAAATEGAEALADNRHKPVILRRLVQRALEALIS